jgi:YVTN family beta-propeller protein
MKKLKLIVLCAVIYTVILASCTKNRGFNNPENSPVNYDALYVVNREGNSLSVINLTSDKVQKTINLGSSGTMMGGGMMNGNSTYNNMWPYHVSLSPDKSKLAITEPGMDFNGGYEMMKVTTSSGGMGGMGDMGSNNYHHHNGNSTTDITDVMQMQGNILILDAVSGDLIKGITLEGMPYDAVFSPDGKELWTALMMPTGKVKVFNTDSYTLMSSITVGNMSAGVVFSDDGKKVFIANGISGSVTVIDAATKLVIDTIVSPPGTVGVFPGMNGMVYTDNEKTNTIGIINTMTNMMSDSIHLGFFPGMVSRDSIMNQMWVSDPDGAKIHFWTQSGVNYLYGGSVPVGSGAGAMIFSKNGETCYVTNQSDNSVSVVDVLGHKEKMKISVGARPNGLIIRYK